MLKNIFKRFANPVTIKSNDVSVTEKANDLAAQALYKSASSFAQQCEYTTAAEFYQRAISLKPDYTNAYVKLGDVLREDNKLDQAINAYQTAIALSPEEPFAYLGLGIIFYKYNDMVAAQKMIEIAIVHQPDNQYAYNALGAVVSSDHDKIADAIELFKKAIEIDPTYIDARANLGISLYFIAKYAEAITILEQTLPLTTDGSIIYYIALILYNQNKLLTAKQHFEKALELDSNSAKFHLIRRDYAFLLLKLGDYKNGWLHYESRRQIPPNNQLYFSHSRWQKGDNIAGKTVLLHTEAGLGDCIQFIRYAPLVAQLGAKVILHCEPELCDLFHSVKGISQIISNKEPLPVFDIYIPLMSLPLVFETIIDTIPTEIPYINANSNKTAYWSNKIKNNSTNINIGIVWSGALKKYLGPHSYYFNQRRHVTLKHYSLLSTIEDITLYSLQKGEATVKLENCSFNIVNYMDEVSDFSETAAIIANLDLVITVCTSVAHLAAAMGKPTWILLHSDACWRWLCERNDSPWYPTVRLFRQDKPGDWDSVISNVKSALIDFKNSKLNSNRND